jgi:tRNA G10  N-methylase Trm11
MKYLVRFAQMHESFRQAEIDSLAELNGLQLEWIYYSDEVGRSRFAREQCSITSPHVDAM